MTFVGAPNPVPIVMSSSQACRSCWRANGRARMEIRQDRSRMCHGVQMWGLNDLVAVEPCIAIAEIVAHEQDNIGPRLSGRGISGRGISGRGISGQECDRNHGATTE